MPRAPAASSSSCDGIREHRVDRDAHRRRAAGGTQLARRLDHRLAGRHDVVDQHRRVAVPSSRSVRDDRDVAIAAPGLLEDHVRRAAALGDRRRPTARSRRRGRPGSGARPRARSTPRSPAPRARSSSGSSRCSSSESRRCRCGSTVTSQSTAPDTSRAKYVAVTPSPGLNWTSWRMNARYGATRPTRRAPRSRAVAARNAIVQELLGRRGIQAADDHDVVARERRSSMRT